MKAYVNDHGNVYVRGEHVGNVIWGFNVPETRRQIEEKGIEWAKELLIIEPIHQ